MVGRDAMGFFSGVLLLVGHDSQNRGHDHTGTMYPLQIPMQAYGSLGFYLRNFGRERGIIRGCKVETRGQGTQSYMGIQIHIAGLGNRLSVLALDRKSVV